MSDSPSKAKTQIYLDRYMEGVEAKPGELICPSSL